MPTDAPPGWGPAPPPGAPTFQVAPQPQQPQQGPMTLRGMNIKGLQFENLNVPQAGEVPKLQQDAQLTEELSTMLNQYKTALDMEASRNMKTKDIDKAILMEKNLPFLKTVGESLADRWELWKYDPTIGGHHLHMGLGGDLPGGQIFLSARLRSRLRPQTLANSSIRAFRAIEDVQEHYPYASDSMKEKYDKYNYWSQTIHDAQDQLREQGINVRSGKPILAPPQNVSPETIGKPTAITAPPFKPTQSVGDRPENLRLRDQRGNWWYYDLDAGRWQQYGG